MKKDLDRARSFLVAAQDRQKHYADLRRKEITLDAATGWCLVKYAGLPLGWVKVLPNRVNNYYPSEWRILKE
jgi:NOL1/NOP2/fmu family ribosome biogenesis protein